jgi:SAM-dependent methyltransferase
MNKPFSQACENNKQPILDIISQYFRPGDKVLEIGSGTGQHMLYFCKKLPWLYWIPSEIPENLSTIKMGLEGQASPNLGVIKSIDVRDDPWPVSQLNGVFSANCLHIMMADFVPDFFRGAGAVIRPGGCICVYGPFRYQGEFTSDSNKSFDQWLKERDPVFGIRDFEWVDELARKQGFSLLADHTMPANNQLLVWKRDPI